MLGVVLLLGGVVELVLEVVLLLDGVGVLVWEVVFVLFAGATLIVVLGAGVTFSAQVPVKHPVSITNRRVRTSLLSMPKTEGMTEIE